MSADLYVIGIGPDEDFEAGRGKVYTEARDNGRALPVFYSHEGLERYALSLAHDPDASPSLARAFSGGRYRMVALEDLGELARLAALSGVEWIVWSPSPEGGAEGLYPVPALGPPPRSR